MSAWLVKTRRAPSRHSRDTRVYGHATTAMHKLSTPPPLAELASVANDAVKHVSHYVSYTTKVPSVFLVLHVGINQDGERVR